MTGSPAATSDLPPCSGRLRLRPLQDPSGRVLGWLWCPGLCPGTGLYSERNVRDRRAGLEAVWRVRGLCCLLGWGSG